MTAAKKKSKKEDVVEAQTASTAVKTAEKPGTAAAESADEHAHDHGHEHEHGHTHTHAHGPVMNEECRREVKVSIPAAEVTTALDKTLQQYQKFARIPGFRPGKAPMSTIRTRFLEDARHEVIEKLLPEHYRAAVIKAELNPISQPNVTNLEFKEGEPLTFTAEFEIMPEFTVKSYKDLKAEKKDSAVTDEEVEATVKELRERQATYDAIEDRELKDGDYAVASFFGKPKGLATIVAKKAEIAAKKAVVAGNAGAKPDFDAVPPAENAQPIELKEVLVEIGGANTVKEFSENLLGAKPGDEKTFDVTYAEDYPDNRLAGHVLQYTAKVEAVKKKVLPELNDDFAKSLGEFATLDELKARIRKDMEAEKRHSVEHTAKEKLVDELVSANPIPVPQTLVEKQIDTRLERGFRALAQQGMPLEQIKKMVTQQLRDAQQNAAMREVKASLLLDKIAELEKVEVTEEDIKKEVEISAAQMGMPVEEVRRRLEQNQGIERMKDRMRNEKALELLYQQ